MKPLDRQKDQWSDRPAVGMKLGRAAPSDGKRVRRRKAVIDWRTSLPYSTLPTKAMKLPAEG